jgi:hypothetical protein
LQFLVATAIFSIPWLVSALLQSLPLSSHYLLCVSQISLSLLFSYKDTCHWI